MTTAPLVSVIIPVFNGERFLGDAIASLHAQHYPALEILVVDDGSTDGTPGLAQSLPGVRYLHQANQGPAAARNYGLREAQGDVIGFLDADDLWPGDELALQLPPLIHDPTLDVVLGRVQYRALDGGIMPDIVWEDETQTTLFYVHLGNALYRRSVFERVGPFDITMQYSEDHDWFLRAREHNVRMTALKAVTLLYRLHDQNMTRAKPFSDLGMLRALQKSLARRRASGDASRQLPNFTDFDPDYDSAARGPLA